MALDTVIRAVVPKPLRLRLRSLAAYPDTARLTADVRSFRRFRRLERSTARWRPDERMVELRLRPLGGAPVLVRPGTQDRWALRDTFLGRYHLPPPELTAAELQTIWDLGANIGLTVGDLAVTYPQARITAVELDSDNARVCRANILPWADRCELIEAAVWPVGGTVAYAREAGNELGFHVVHEDRRGRPSVPTLRLDVLLERTPGTTVDYVKMDIEGAEREVLTRETEWASHVRSIKVEVHAPYSVEECLADLARLGFAARRDDRHAACAVGVRTV